MRVFALLALFSCVLFSAPPKFPPKINAEVFSVFDIEIKNLPDSRRIYIATPKNAKDSDAFNALFILDANAQFPMLLNLYARNVASNCLKSREVIESSFESNCLEAPKSRDLIIVGFGYDSNLAYETKRRSYDYLPARADSEDSTDSDLARDSEILSEINKHKFRDLPTGGASEFLKYLNPKIDEIKSRFNIKKTALFGHSFGGVFCLYALLAQKSNLNHYICASSALYYGNFSFNTKLSKFPDSITLTLGELEKSKNDAREALFRDLKESAQDSKIRYIEFENKTHGESLIDSLEFALKIFELKEF